MHFIFTMVFHTVYLNVMIFNCHCHFISARMQASDNEQVRLLEDALARLSERRKAVEAECAEMAGARERAARMVDDFAATARAM